MVQYAHAAEGVYALSATPFDPDGRLDLDSTDSLVDFYLSCGASGLTLLGILGEAPKLDAEEALTFVKRVVRRANGKPVVVGVSSPGFAAMSSLAKSSMDAGASAVLIGPPGSLRTDDQIIGYFQQAAEAIGPDIPFVLQDHPLMLQVVMTPKVIRQIVQDVPSCRMLKHEDWPGLEKLSALRAFERDGSMRRLPILCANGGLFLDMELDRGADGSMTGYAFPDMLVELFNLFRSGRRDDAQDLFDAHLPLLRYEHQTGVGLAVRKYVLMRRGAIKYDAQRKPASSISSRAQSEVEYLLSRIGKRYPRFKV